jgi:hypothetical protein
MFKGVFIVLGTLFLVGLVLLWSNPAVTKSLFSRFRDEIRMRHNGVGQLSNIDSTTGGTQQQKDVPEKELAAQDRMLVEEKEELDHLNDLSKLFVTVSGVFALVLGVASWKSLDEQRKASADNILIQKENLDSQFTGLVEQSKRQFQSLVEQSEKSLEKVAALKEELQREFPMFGRMQNNFSNILNGLHLSCLKLSLEDRTYEKLDWHDEQKILFYENVIATALLLDTKEYSSQLSEIYRLLGAFYGSRFFIGLEDGKIGKERSDLNRARFYFDRSIDLNPKNYFAYMYAGHFTQYATDQSIARVSRDYFERATAIGTKYQKPWVAIALIELEAFSNPLRALTALEEASRREQYEMNERSSGIRDPKPEVISYLQACAHCQRAGQLDGQGRTKSLEVAIEKFRRSSEKMSPVISNMFKADKNSYYRLLQDDPRFLEEFNDIAKRFEYFESQHV